jgi:hypothetical protein
MYGGEEGFSLGLSVWDIPDLHSGIRKVVYGQAEQAAAARASLRVALGRVQEFAETFGTAQALQHVDEFAGWIVPAAAFGSAAFKSSDWKDEEEWRIVVLQPRKGVAPGLRREPVKFRLSDRGIVPYITLPLVAGNGQNAGQLPVTEVYLGPTSDVDVKANGLTRLLEENGYSARTTTIRASRGTVAGAEGKILDW